MTKFWTLLPIVLAAALPAHAQSAVPDAAVQQTVPAPAPAPAAAPAPQPAPLPSDARERVQAVCMAEARSKAQAAGATEVLLKDVQDTDVKSGGYASMRAKVEIVSVDAKGKTSRKRGTFGCATRNDVITSFNFD